MKYYILYNEENKGPLSIEEMEEFDLNPSSRVWAPGWPSWKDASEVEEIMAYFAEREKQISAASAAPQPMMQPQQPMQPQPASPFQQTPASPAVQPQPANQQYSAGQQYTVNQPAPQVEPAHPSYPPQREWYMGINNRESGPFREDQLPAAGLTPDTLVWCESMPTWMAARQVPELAYLLPQTMQPQIMQPAVAVTPEGQSDELPLNMEYEMASPWIPNIIGGVLTLIAILLFILIIADTPYYFTAVVGYAATPLIWLICGLISASRVSDAVNATQYILAGRRCGAARAWGWITIITAIVSILVLACVLTRVI